MSPTYFFNQIMKPAMGLFCSSMHLGVRCTGTSYDAVIDLLLPSDGVAGCVAQGIWGYVGGLWSITSISYGTGTVAPGAGHV